jgi:hypothetical protein
LLIFYQGGKGGKGLRKAELEAIILAYAKEAKKATLVFLS